MRYAHRNLVQRYLLYFLSKKIVNSRDTEISAPYIGTNIINQHACVHAALTSFSRPNRVSTLAKYSCNAILGECILWQ